MNNLSFVGTTLDLCFGPLAASECRRASSRGWIFLGRAVAAVIASVVLLMTLAIWAILERTMPGFQPYDVLRGAVATLIGGLLFVGLVMPPALLAGAIAGERERGTLALLLTTKLSAAEILSGRLAGRFSLLLQVYLIAWPLLAFLLWLAGFSLATQACAFAFLCAISLGSSGLALAASSWSRRSRDALLGTYILTLLLVASPIASDWLLPINPFAGLDTLAFSDDPRECLVSSLIWLAMGGISFAIACKRVRLAGGTTATSRQASRRWRVPEVDEDDPMLWKELHVDRVATFGRVSRWLVALLIAWLAVGPVVLLGLDAWDALGSPIWSGGHELADVLERVYGIPAIAVMWLIVGILALRASVSIASERERGTWDALLTSPLDGKQIIRAKIRGNLHAMRWLLLAALFAWSVTTAFNPGYWARLLDLLLSLAVLGFTLTALGVRISLSTNSTTRAMATSAGTIIALQALVGLISVIVMMVGALCCLFLWIYLVNAGYAEPNSKPTFFLSSYVAYRLIYYPTMLSIGLSIAAETALAFDRLAGRMTEGKQSLRFERMLGHGRRSGDIRTHRKPKARPAKVSPDAPPAA